MQARTLWYVRRNGEVKGPFPTAVISQDLLVGRLTKHDEVSPDQHYWQKIADVDALLPEVMKADLTASGQQDNLTLAIRNADERAVDRRARNASETAADERRKSDRRAREADFTVDYRSRKTQRLQHIRGEKSVNKLQAFGIIFFVVAGLVAIAALYTPQNEGPTMDCAARPGPGVNWSNCDFQGVVLDGVDLSRALIRNANLSGSRMQKANLRETDLAYSDISLSRLNEVNMQGALLTGADLKGSDLSGADLTGADLSYANLWGANIAGAKFDGARLDKAVWVDRETCVQGSVGRCLVTN